MAFSLTDQATLWSLDLARACRIDLYSLHYDLDWTKIYNKYFILKALAINNIYDIYDSDTLQCLQDAVKVNTFCNC